jgi:hypothetical protein
VTSIGTWLLVEPGRTEGVAVDAQLAHHLNERLLDAADRLIAEFDELPSGSVLRCLSRANVVVRRAGTPVDFVPEAAERTARQLLSVRTGDPRLVVA